MSIRSAALEQTYRYPAPSSVSRPADGARLLIATSGGPQPNPRLFRGAVRRPDVVADALLAVASVARARFFTPPSMLARILLAADPIVTCTEERIRFESLSACRSAYARLDLLADAVDGEIVGRGTTNVDVGPEMRAALAGVDAGPLWMEIGLDEVEIRSATGRAVERRVPLPESWIRALTEVAAIQEGMVERLDLGPAEAGRLLRTLARGTGAKEAWLVPSARGVRVAHHPAPGSFRVGGPQRLRAVERMRRHLVRLRIHRSDDGSTAWRWELPDARLTVLLSPDPWRGLSGEGRLLSTLARASEPAVLAAVRAQLRWQPIVTVAGVVSATGRSEGEVRVALASLAASGVLGFDTADGGYFHRELPFDVGSIDRNQPRLREAHRLVSAGGVRVETSAEDELVAWVAGTGVEHRVRVATSGSTCTCPWFGRHRGERGPCKHILAVRILSTDPIASEGDAALA